MPIFNVPSNGTTHEPKGWSPIGKKRRQLVMAAVLAASLLGVVLPSMVQTSAAASPDGLSVTVTPVAITPAQVTAGTAVFTLHVTDANKSGTPFDNYLLSGMPTSSAWLVMNKGAIVLPLSKNPYIYSLPKADVIAGKITIQPRAGATTLTGLTLSRMNSVENLVTDFDNGTFDYIGTAKPTIPSNTKYGYHDPQVVTPHGSCSPQYGPCDGYYTIWPTANMNGPAQHYNNMWADVRSITNPMVTPSTATICANYNVNTFGDWASNTTQVSLDQSSNSGKVAIFNGSDTTSPTSMLTTKVTGLKADTKYVFSYNTLNLSDDTSNSAVRSASVAAYANNSIAGSTGVMMKQDGCTTDKVSWIKGIAVVGSDATGSVNIDIRDNSAGGFGNDVAFDNIALYPLEVVSFDLPITTDAPHMTVAKMSSPASGSAVAPGQTVTYTVTGKNDGIVNLNPMKLTDDLSDVLDNATLVASSLNATVNGTTATAPTIDGDTLTWSGAVPAGQAVELTYQVVVSGGAKPSDTLTNRVVGSGTDAVNATTPVPSNCVLGTEDGCFSELSFEKQQQRQPGLTVGKVSNPGSGSPVEPGQEVTYTVTAQNTGDVDLKPVLVTDDLGDVLKRASLDTSSLSAVVGGAAVTAPTFSNGILLWSGPLAVNDTVTITYSVTISNAVQTGDKLINSVIASGTDPGNPGGPVPCNCQLGDEDGCSSTVIGYNPKPFANSAPELTIGKVSDPASGSKVDPGQVITYTVTAENTGDVDLDSAKVTDNLTSVFASAALVEGSLQTQMNDNPSANEAVINGNTLSWSGSLKVGDKLVITYEVKVKTGVLANQTIKNNVTGVFADPDKPSDELTANCENGTETGCNSDLTTASHPSLAYTKTSDPKSGSKVKAGQNVAYTVTVTNTGDTDLSMVNMTDNLSEVVKFADLDLSSLSAKINDDSVTAPTVNPSNVLSWSGPLAAGDTLVVTYSAKVRDDIKAGDKLTNNVVVNGVDPDDPGHPIVPDCVTDCSSVLDVQAADLQVSKSSTPVSGSQVDPGQTITYTLTAKNTGNVDLETASVSDDLSAISQYVTVDKASLQAMVDGVVAESPTINDGVLSWVGPLDIGQTATITYKTVVNADVLAGQIIQNKVTGAVIDPGNPDVPKSANCVDGTEAGCNSQLTVTSQPGLSYTKTSDPVSGSTVKSGQVVTYTVTVVNTGNTGLYPVEVADNLANVLAHATPVEGSVTTKVNGSLLINQAVITGDELSWSGPLAAGDTLAISYQVTVNPGLTSNDSLINGVTVSGAIPGDPDPIVPTCTTDCSSTLTGEDEPGSGTDNPDGPGSGTDNPDGPGSGTDNPDGPGSGTDPSDPGSGTDNPDGPGSGTDPSDPGSGTDNPDGPGSGTDPGDPGSGTDNPDGPGSGTDNPDGPGSGTDNPDGPGSGTDPSDPGSGTDNPDGPGSGTDPSDPGSGTDNPDGPGSGTGPGTDEPVQPGKGGGTPVKVEASTGGSLVNDSYPTVAIVVTMLMSAGGLVLMRYRRTASH